MLHPLPDGAFGLRCFTDKGRALFGNRRPAAPPASPAPEPKFDPRRVSAFAAASFEAPFWTEQSLACIGCGACAYTCPTCHCFDIVDEGSPAAGARVKNWDSCQFPLFTAHASGHNPRASQAQRQRQRIYHKFHLYPEKFGALLCTGCGNCARNCPAGLGVLRLIQSIPPEAAR
jgi:ferredoxin